MDDDSAGFDEFGFAVLENEEEEEEEITEEVQRCHLYSPLPGSGVIESWRTVCREWKSRKEHPKLYPLLKRGIPRGLRSEVWQLCLATSEFKSHSTFNYQNSLNELYCKLKHYDISDSSSEDNIRAISSLLDCPVMVGGEGVEEGGEGVREGEVEGDGERWVEEKDKEWLRTCRQILLDVNRTFPTHRLFIGDTETKASLYRVLMMYTVFNPTVGYCQGMAYVAGLLLMYMNEEESFWSALSLFEGPQYLSGFYDSKLTRVHTYADVFSLMLRERQPKLALHLDRLGVHPLMYVTSWFMCLFTSLPCWDTVLAICDLIFLEGVHNIFRVALAILEVCSPELMAMYQIETVLPFIQKLPSRLVALKVLMPVVWRTTVLQSDVEAFQERVLRGPENVRPPKRAAPSGGQRTPAKRRRVGDQPLPSTPASQSFFSRLVSVLTPASRQTVTLEHSSIPPPPSPHPSCFHPHSSQMVRSRAPSRRVDLQCRVPEAEVRSSRKRKRVEWDISPPSESIIEMKEFSNFSFTAKGALFSASSPFSPSLSPFLSNGGIQDSPASLPHSSPSHSSSRLSSGRSPRSREGSLRRSARIAHRRALKGNSHIPAASFISPRRERPLQNHIHNTSCTDEKLAFRTFTTPTPLRASQKKSTKPQHCKDLCT